MAHILVLEPDTLLGVTYARALQQAGHTASHVSTAQAAIDSADQQAPDLVLLELQLPAHNGIEFLHEFRSYSEWQHVPAIINSFIPPHELGISLEQVMAELGISAYYYKPELSLQNLLRSISATLTAAK
jgi:DNA-binding response OmpR family regulator